MKTLNLFLIGCLSLPAITSTQCIGDETTTQEKEKKTAKHVDPSGTWRWESDGNGTTQEHQLRLNANDQHEVTGTYYGLIDGLKSTKGSIKGNKLTLVFEAEREGVEFTATYEATIKGDSAVGTISFESNQGSGDMDWEAKRSVTADDVVGTWELAIETPNGDVMKPTLEITKNGKQLSGKYNSPRAGELDVKSLRVKKNNLLVTVTAEFNGTNVQVDFKGKPRGNKMKGTVEFSFDGNTREGEFSAKRKTDD